MKCILTAMTCLMLTLGAIADEVAALRPVIKEAAAANGVDPVLMEAIIRHESANATSHAARRKNNLAGIMGRKGQRKYETKEACVQDLGRLLGKYKSKGRVTVAQIGRVYCQSTSPWASHVNTFMRQIRAGRWGAVEEAAQQ